MKDKLIGKTLLKGKLKICTYQLSLNNYSYVYIFVNENSHRNLGHPNNKVQENMLKDYNVKISYSDIFIFSEA